MARGVIWLLLAAAILYFAFPSAVLECDAVIYSCAGLSGDIVQSTDAGHLAWGFLEMGAARIGRALDPPLNPIYLLRYLAILASLGGLIVFARLAAASGASNLATLFTTGTLALSYSYWHFGIQAESHLVATFFLLCFAASGWRYFQEGSIRQVVMASVFLSGATLMHQTCILLVPAFLLPAAWDARGRDNVWKVLLAFLISYFLLTIVSYLMVGWFVRDLRTIGDFREWILGLSLWGSWGQWSLRSLPGALIGAGRSLVGSHYLLGIVWIEWLAYRVVPNASWGDELALAVTVPDVLRYPLLILQTVYFCVILVGLVQGLKRLRAAWRADSGYAFFLVLWLAIYVPFIIWWAPVRAEFWIAVFVPLLLLLGRGLWVEVPRRIWQRGMPVALVTALGLLNLVGSMWPQARPEVEPQLGRLIAIEAVAEAGDFVISDSGLLGRATRFVYSLDKVNLLDPSPYRSSRLSPGAEGAPPNEADFDPDDLIPIPDTDHPKDRSLGTLEAVLEIARAENRTVYLAMQSLGRDENRAARYGALLSEVEEKFQLSEPVPVRGDRVWRRVEAVRN